MSSNKKGISTSVIKRLCATSHNQCAFPGCNQELYFEDASLGQICHIKGENPSSARYDEKQSSEDRQSFSNLILLCPNHHKIIDDNPNKYTTEFLYNMKEKHIGAFPYESNKVDPKWVELLKQKLSIKIETNEAPIFTQNLTIKQSKGAINKVPLEGSIGASEEHRAYIKYLIDRYHKCATEGIHQRKDFSYAVIYVNIRKKFGNNWDRIKIERFDDLVKYLQGCIDRTEFGRNNKKGNERNFHSFDEHITIMIGK